MKGRLLKNTLLVSAGEVMVKLLGFARDVLIAGIFGATAQLDAFFVALNVPSIFVSFLGNSLTTAFIPVYFRYRIDHAEEERHKFLANLTTCTILVFASLTIAVYIFAAPVVRLMAPGFPESQAKFAALLVRVFSGLTLLTGLGLFLRAPAQCENRFGWPVSADIANNALVLLVTVLLCPYFGIYGLTYAFILGALAQTLILFFRYYRDGGRLKLRFSFVEPGLLEIFRLSLPLYVGMLTANIGIVIDRAMASGLAAGSISALTYADKIRTLPITVFGSAMITVMFPTLSRLAALKQKEQTIVLLERASKVTLLVCSYIVNMVWLLALPITVVLFERGNFSRAAAIMTSEALRFFILGLPAVVLGSLLLRVFHANKDTKRPVAIGLVSVTANIGLNLLLIDSLAHQGIALATATANWIWFVLLLVFLRYRYRLPVLSLTAKNLWYFGKLAGVNLVIYAIGRGLCKISANKFSEPVILVVIAAVGTICLAAGIFLLKIHKDLDLQPAPPESDNFTKTQH